VVQAETAGSSNANLRASRRIDNGARRRCTANPAIENAIQVISELGDDRSRGPQWRSAAAVGAG